VPAQQQQQRQWGKMGEWVVGCVARFLIELRKVGGRGAYFRVYLWFPSGIPRSWKTHLTTAMQNELDTDTIISSTETLK